MLPQKLNLHKKLIPVVRTTVNGKRCYTIDGTECFYPSVTTVLSCRGNKSLHEWRKRVGEEQANKISRIASGTGTAFHTLCEMYLNADPRYDNQLRKIPQATSRFKKFIPALSNITAIYFQEVAVVSPTLEVGGTIDLFGYYENKIAIIDFKTSRRKKSLEDIMSYFAQCYAYAVAIKDMYDIIVEDAVILMSYEDGYEVFRQPIDYGKKFFLESRIMYATGKRD